MTSEIKNAIDWSLSQTVDYGDGVIINVTKKTRMALVDKVREYFNENNIEYDTFSYDDLTPYL